MNSELQIKNLLNPINPIKSPAAKSPKPSGRRMSYFKKITGLFRKIIVGQPPPIRLSSPAQKRELSLSVGIILITLLAVSIGFGWHRRRQLRREAKISQYGQRVEWVLSQARQLAAISPVRARQIIRDEKTALESEISRAADKPTAARLNELLDRLNKTELEAGRVVMVQPEVYLDLNLIRLGAVGAVMASNQDRLLVLDRESPVLLSISPADRSGEVIGGGEALASARAIAAAPAGAYVLGDRRVVEINYSSHTSLIAITDDENEWQNPEAIGAFAGNLYLLSSSLSEIYKYPAIEGGFGSRRRWLAPGTRPDLSSVVNMEIAGDIWLLHKNGKIIRYRRGDSIDPVISFSDLPDPISSAVAFSVPDKGGRVWVLDSGHNRVVSFDRESGEYAGQWVFSGISPSGLAANEQLGKIFLLDKEKIYSFDFK